MKTYKLEVQSGKASGTNSDFAAYVDLSELPASFWNEVANGGGDIRCWSAVEPPSVQLAREVVSCDTSTDTGELWVKCSMSSTTTIYITVDGSSTEPAADSTYGREAVWSSDYKGVYHLDDVNDSTNLSNDLTAVSAPSAVAGKLGKGYSFDGVDDSLQDTSFTDFGTASFTIQCWVYLDSASIQGAFFKLGDTDDGVGLGVGTTRFDPTYEGNNLVGLYEAVRWIPTGDAIGTGWHRLELKINASGYPEMFIDGVSVYSDTTGAMNNPAAQFRIGGYTTGTNDRFVEAIVDEVRVVNAIVSADKSTTEYNNQSDVSTFWGITEINRSIKRYNGTSWEDTKTNVYINEI